MCSYLQVSKENCLSTGNAARHNKKAIKRRLREDRKDLKRRRIQLENERGSSQYQQAVREGTTREEDVGLWHFSGMEEIPPPIQPPQGECLSSVDSDMEEIPSPIQPPQGECLSSVDSAINIVFDVETTSFGNYINLLNQFT